MKTTIDHVAVVGDDYEKLLSFYVDVMGLSPMETPRAQSSHMGKYQWLRLGDQELHVIHRDTRLAKVLGLEFDPLMPHFAINVEDVAALRGRLAAAGARMIDWSSYGIAGKNQFFVLDPGGNLVEIQSK